MPATDEGSGLIRVCEVCGVQFSAKRSDARCCSATCRSRKHRGVAMSEPAAPRIGAILDQEDILSLIQAAHGAASDLSRASLLAPSPLCLHLKRAALGMEAALRGEDL